MNGFFGTTTADVVATWVAAIATLVVLGSLLGERRLFGWSQHLLAGPRHRVPGAHRAHRGHRPAAGRAAGGRPGRPPRAWLGVAVVAVTAAAPWLPRLLAAVPASIAIGSLAAFALGGAVVGTLLPQLDASIVRPRRFGRGHRRRRGRRASSPARAHRVPARHAAGQAPRDGGRVPGDGCCSRASVAGSGTCSCRGSMLLVDRIGFLARRLDRDRPMTMQAVSAELALLVDVGSAWAKAGVIGQVRGRWRLVAHAAQPTAWGSAELRRALVDAAGSRGRSAARRSARRAAGRREPDRVPHRPAAGSAGRSWRSRARCPAVAARRAAEAAGWQVAEVVTLDDGRSLADRLGTLQAAEIDAWLWRGGFDGAASPRALEVAALVAAARRPGGAGRLGRIRALRDEVVAMFERSRAEVPNPRPDARRDDPGPLRERLRELLRDVAAPEEDAPVASPCRGQSAPWPPPPACACWPSTSAPARRSARWRRRTERRQPKSRAQAGWPGPPTRGRGPRSRLAGDAGDEATVADLIQTLRAGLPACRTRRRSCPQPRPRCASSWRPCSRRPLLGRSTC